MIDTTAIKSSNSSFDFIHLIDVMKWPLLVLVIVLIVKKPIVDLISRITKIGLPGTTFEAQQQQSSEKEEQKQVSNVDRALGIFRDETLEKFKKAVLEETQLDKIPLDKDKVSQLLNYSIVIYIIKHYDSIYSSIYGSQLAILQQLNTNSSETENSIRRYYDNVAKNFPKVYDDYAYDEYLGFLYSHSLIVKNGDKIAITNNGIDFLKYLIETGKSANKFY